MEPSDKRYRKGELTRAKILYSAITLIAEDGLKEISTSKLAKATGISKSTIFHHFASSDEVLTSALSFLVDEMLHYFTNTEYQSLEHFLQSIGAAMFQQAKSEATLFKSFLSFSHESLFHPAYRDILTAYTTQLEDFFLSELRRLLPQSINDDKMEEISSLLLPMMDGIGFHYMLHNERSKYEKIWELQTKHIFRILISSR